MKKFLLVLLLSPMFIWAQPQNINHIPHIETSAKADSLVVPDEIYLTITLREQDERKLSVEQLEKRMFEALKKLGIDLEMQLKLSDASSNIKTYFLGRKDIKKSKRYELKLDSATAAGQVLVALEEKGISNARITKTDYSQLERLKLELLGKAVTKAKQRAHVMAKPLEQKVGKAIYISDTSSGFTGFRRTNMLNEVVMYSMAEEVVETTPEIQFKPQKVSVSVSIRFRLD